MPNISQFYFCAIAFYILVYIFIVKYFLYLVIVNISD
jgi:hypothetical protein